MWEQHKVLAAQHVLDSGARLVWTDDQFAPTSGEYYDAYTESGQALFIRPDPRRGLRREDVDEIKRFVLGS